MTLTEKAKDYLIGSPAPVECRAEVFASMVHISVSHMRRKLRREGTSWNALRNAEIYRRSEAMLAAGMSVDDISDSLGYSWHVNLQRFYRTVVGETMRAAAARHRGESVSQHLTL